MKRLIPLLLFPCFASAGDGFNFNVEDAKYELFESSVRSAMVDKKLIVTGLWEARFGGQSYRWTVHVTGCETPYGSIIVHGDGFVDQYNWTIEGLRTYDLLAFNTCFKYQLTPKPGKTSEDRAKKY